jgi:hypothetical protein
MRHHDPFGVVIPPECPGRLCGARHPSIAAMRCQLPDGHDGWHHAENIWWH